MATVIRTSCEAIQRRPRQLDQVIFAGFTHEPAEAARRGAARDRSAGLAHVFFSDSGSTSVEVALKMALGYWRNIGEPRSRIRRDGTRLSRRHHRHDVGRRARRLQRAYEPLLFDVDRIPFPQAGREQATLDALEARLPPATSRR